MYEDTDGSLGLYVLDRYDIIRVMRCISDGIDDFLSFCDDHFTRLIKAKVGEHMGQG